jgi:hypothetical protein
LPGPEKEDNIALETSRTHLTINTVSYYSRRLEPPYNTDYKMIENYTECHPCFILVPSHI